MQDLQGQLASAERSREPPGQLPAEDQTLPAPPPPAAGAGPEWRVVERRVEEQQKTISQLCGEISKWVCTASACGHVSCLFSTTELGFWLIMSLENPISFPQLHL